jgi:dTDP-4-amino-4,6-dideoxygalactose transaminase
MLPEHIIQQLKSENALLHVQLNDLDELIRIREEELEILRTKAAQVAALQSNLDENIYQLEQMQLFLGDQERQVAGANRRELSMETEMIESLQMEKDYYTLSDKLKSTRAALEDVSEQFAEASALFREVATLKSTIAELESKLEIESLDNQFLREEYGKR